MWCSSDLFTDCQLTKEQQDKTSPYASNYCNNSHTHLFLFHSCHSLGVKLSVPRLVVVTGLTNRTKISTSVDCNFLLWLCWSQFAFGQKGAKTGTNSCLLKLHKPVHQWFAKAFYPRICCSDYWLVWRYCWRIVTPKNVLEVIVEEKVEKIPYKSYRNG